MPSPEETTVHPERPGAGPVGQDRPYAAPTRSDSIAAAASELIGGPLGRRARGGTAGRFTPAAVVALTAIGMFALGMVQKLPCYNWAWFRGASSQYTHACYSDIPHLYLGRGFSEGLVPYFDRLPGDMEYLEYPVLTGLFMQVASWISDIGFWLGISDGDVMQREQLYWLVNAGMLMVCTAVIAVCVARTHRHRPWDGMLVALAPAFALTATINWDLFAVALTAAAMLMWSRGRVLAFGILIGLATAAKLYPVFLLAPLLPLCWRTGRWRPFLTACLSAAGAWLAVNLPVMVLAPEGWKKFYAFSQERSIDFGSFWLVITQRTGKPIDVQFVNDAAIALVVVAFVGLCLLTLKAPRRPRFAQLVFLLVAVFILTNKVYSPQYVLWLIPLAALARPRWRDFLIWQACEVLYFLGIWMYLAYTTSEKHQGLPAEGYQLAIALHLLGTLYLCAVILRDILRPERDVVRRDGDDDPSGGILDGAEDVFVLGATGSRKGTPDRGGEQAYAARGALGGPGAEKAPRSTV
ncbi:glycosyltransferase family 87 protein [Streptomyces sp. NPDC090029]|uniref:glycosyltransferase family 87 protein n=1 Tax=Streptomyces sp. NPDC090029 TaxID=3365924 RepID=UPI0038093AC6